MTSKRSPRSPTVPPPFPGERSKCLVVGVFPRSPALISGGTGNGHRKGPPREHSTTTQRAEPQHWDIHAASPAEGTTHTQQPKDTPMTKCDDDKRRTWPVHEMNCATAVLNSRSDAGQFRGLQQRCSTTGVTFMTRIDDTPTTDDANPPWPASVYPRGGGLSRRCRTASRPRQRPEPPRGSMRRQTQRLDASRAQRSDTGQDDAPSSPVLPPMPGLIRVSTLVGLATRVAAPTRHGGRWSSPPATARTMTADSDRLPAPHSHERGSMGVIHTTSTVGRLDSRDSVGGRHA